MQMVNLQSTPLKIEEGGTSGIRKTSGTEHAIYLTSGHALLVISSPGADWKYPIAPLTALWIPDGTTYEIKNSGAGNIGGVFFEYRV